MLLARVTDAAHWLTIGGVRVATRELRDRLGICSPHDPHARFIMSITGQLA